ncbi:ferredoxin [Filifactor villosus]|uniref:Ferredoxin n=1 Tax=Filifactor villosus TaxID=29374 RepID=A0ABV9QJM0_9FIRM|nr:ferredoxin [Filifactor alocis]
MKLRVNGKECIGCKLCVRTMPDIFFINENKEADVQKQPEEMTEQLRVIIESCPEHAIEWED